MSEGGYYENENLDDGLSDADRLSQGRFSDGQSMGRSARSRYTQRSRTGGLIELANVKPDDFSKEREYSQDEFNKMDFEKRQISEK